MMTTKKKLGNSEISLIKDYCSRVSDDDLHALATLLPQSIAGDRSMACGILQRDKEVDRWLAQAAGWDDWFSRADAIGEFAAIEADLRAKKSK
jgi:hypothetical protein